MAADRTAPGQGREARSLHRDGTRGSERRQHRPAIGVLAARVPRYLRDRAAQPGAPDPLRDPERTRRRRRRAVVRAVGRPGSASCAATAVPLFSVDTHRPAGDFDVIAFNLSAELVYTNVLNCLDLAGVPVRSRARRPDDPHRRRRRALHVQPRAHGRLRRRLRHRRRRGGRRRDDRGHRGVEARRDARPARGSCASSPRSRACTCPPCTRSSTTGRSSARCARATPTCPRAVDKRTVADLADWPYPKSQLVPLIEVVHDRLNVEIFRGCTRGCRFCQAGMITRPVRERPEEQVRTMVQDGLRRTGYDEVALTSLSSADFSGVDGLVADLVNEQEGTGCVGPLAAVAARRRVHGRHRQRDPEGPPHRAHVRARRRARGASARSSTSSSPRKTCTPRSTARTRRAGGAVKLYFLTGLPTEMDEDTLGDRRAGAQRRRRRSQVHEAGELHARRSAGSCPSRTRRSSGSARTASTSSQRKIGLLRERGAQVRRAAALARPRRRRSPKGIASRGDRRIGRGDRARVARRRDVPGVERALRARPLARARWRPKGSTPTGT